MNELGTILVCGLVLGGAWFFFSPRLDFKIRIANGAVSIAKGAVTRDVLQQVGEIVRESNISRGWIGGKRIRGRLSLSFSHDIPAGCRQQIRNLWINH